MIELTKKYRLVWERFTLNVQNDHKKDWSGSTTQVADPQNKFDSFESDVYQDVLDKIFYAQLNVLGEHVHYDENI